MKLFRTKVWSWLDIALLKWSSILLGMIAGAHLAEFTKRNLYLLAAAALLMAIRPAAAYFRPDRSWQRSHGNVSMALAFDVYGTLINADGDLAEPADIL